MKGDHMDTGPGKHRGAASFALLTLAGIALASLLATSSCAARQDSGNPGGTRQFLYAWMGAVDPEEPDFLAVFDADPLSRTYGAVLSTLPVDLYHSLPHHMEYEMPGEGEPLFVNAHMTEDVLLFDFSDPAAPRLLRTLDPVPPLRYPHDMVPLPNGNVLVGYLRSEGPSPVPGDTTVPGGHGGLAEFTRAGDLVRWASAADPEVREPIRPYSFAALPDIDRLVVTSAPMMESHSADVVQIWRLSDLTLLETLPVPPALLSDGTPLRTRDPASGELRASGHRWPFVPRVMPDGSVLLNAFGCGLYRVSGLDRAAAQIENVYTFEVPEDAGLGACGIPVHTGRFWVMAVGGGKALVTLDVSDPARPHEIARLETGGDFRPHWLAKDPRSNRLIVGADLGDVEEWTRMLVALLDPQTGELSWDERLTARNGRLPGIDFARIDWPHGDVGLAFAHAALFQR